MRWFRSNVKRVSHVELFALAIQVVLAFGHFHGVASQAASVVQSGSAQSGFLVANNLTALKSRTTCLPRNLRLIVIRATSAPSAP